MARSMNNKKKAMLARRTQQVPPCMEENEQKSEKKRNQKATLLSSRLQQIDSNVRSTKRSRRKKIVPPTRRTKLACCSMQRKQEEVENSDSSEKTHRSVAVVGTVVRLSLQCCVFFFVPMCRRGLAHATGWGHQFFFCVIKFDCKQNWHVKCVNQWPKGARMKLPSGSSSSHFRPFIALSNHLYLMQHYYGPLIL